MAEHHQHQPSSPEKGVIKLILDLNDHQTNSLLVFHYPPETQTPEKREIFSAKFYIQLSIKKITTIHNVHRNYLKAETPLPYLWGIVNYYNT